MTNPFDGSPEPQGYGYQQPEYAPQPGAQKVIPPGSFDAMDSLTQAWRIITEKPLGWLLSSVVYFAIFGVIAFFGYIIFLVNVALIPEGSDEFPVMPFVTFCVLLLVGAISLVLWELVLTREAVYAAGGKRPEFKDFFTFQRCGILFVGSILIALASMLGFLVFIIGSFVVSIALMFVMPALVFDDMSIGAAFKSSFEVVKANLGQTLLLFVLIAILNGIGGSLGAATIVTVPFGVIATAHAYMKAAGRPLQHRNPTA